MAKYVQPNTVLLKLKKAFLYLSGTDSTNMK